MKKSKPRPPSYSREVALIHWMIAPLSSLIICELVLLFVYSFDAQKDVIMGWAAGVIFHLVGLFLFHRAVGSEIDRFMLLALGGIITRLFILIIFIVIVLVGGFLQAGPFITGLLTAYFTGSWMEIVLMAKLKPGEVHHPDRDF